MKSKKYLSWVREQDCQMCGKPGPSHAHHIKGIGYYSGVAGKAPDIAVMPLCGRCHDLMHNKPELWETQWEHMGRTIVKAALAGKIDYGQESENKRR